MRLIQFDNAGQLCDRAHSWDELWQASDVAAPTARASLVALWLEHYAPHEAFRCLTVEQDGALCAVLPLVQTRIKRLVPAGGMASNCWSAAGELLIDPLAPDTVLDLLVREIGKLPWPLLWLEGVDPDTQRWRRWLAACDRAGLDHEFREDQVVALIDIGDDWPAYEASRGKHHTRNMRKARRRLDEAGCVEFLHSRVQDETQAEVLLRRAFEIEERSWKATGGTPVLRAHGSIEFFTEQARQLAAWDALDFSFLEVDGEPMAFEYGYRGKGVHFGHKTGFDERLAPCSAGQLLMGDRIRTLHDDPDVQVLDTLGPQTAALSRWCTRTYREGRLMVASRTLLGRTLQLTWRTASQMRNLAHRLRRPAPEKDASIARPIPAPQPEEVAV